MTRTTVFDGEAARGLFPVRRDDECDGRSESSALLFWRRGAFGVSANQKKATCLFFSIRGC